MQKQEFEERIERTVTDEQYKVIEEVYMWHPSIRNTVFCIIASMWK